MVFEASPTARPVRFDRDEIIIHIVRKPLGYIHAYDMMSSMYMHYMYSKISLVFTFFGVSKDTVFALSSVLLKRQCLRLRQLGLARVASVHVHT